MKIVFVKEYNYIRVITKEAMLKICLKSDNLDKPWRLFSHHQIRQFLPAWSFFLLFFFSFLLWVYTMQFIRESCYMISVTWLIGKNKMFRCSKNTPLPAHSFFFSAPPYKSANCNRRHHKRLTNSTTLHLYRTKALKLFEKLNMDQCFRIAVWMFFLVGYLQASPVPGCSMNMDDLSFDVLLDVKCVSYFMIKSWFCASTLSFDLKWILTLFFISTFS